ncbi:hypothetical protein [Mucilaginibacter aquaedulcis]|uniref:hypothetical protein n=1 Tax=Mucilaginibacter aquaedulcis TaxID=1187081 RepID=UPI0025B51B9B|nr:hypothetical protein [Mucilaginibacter aquaedulcis]MDN3550336.1 hypothetical protein [Mucilaginibacter aquaedulcis]
MKLKPAILTYIICIAIVVVASAQQPHVQQGLVLKNASAMRLGSVSVINKHSGIKVRSNTIGVFSIAAIPGDTLQFTDPNYLSTEFVVTDLSDKIIYLQPLIELAEVVVKGNTLLQEIRETQLGYRKKSVFYTGTPHYYYLFLKPMTFIYENFKSEVKDARRFNRFARRELMANEINKRFNDSLIKQIVPIKANEIDDFRTDYNPTIQQLNSMNDYDLINYIKNSYQDFKSKNGVKGKL